jgi:biopolymer transport protein ExbB
VDSSPIILAQDFFKVGGPVVVILVSLSVIAVTVILLKLWQFRVLNKKDLTVVNKAIRLHRTSHSQDALTLLQDSSNPVAQTVAVAIKGTQNVALSENMVREEIVRYATEKIEQLRIHFRTLEVISTISPLLGLFGTVLGMIDSFRQLSLAGSQVDPSVLSGGIWVALLTTAVGLAVAIPVVVVLNFLERIVERTSHAMENAVTQVFTIDLTSVTDTSNESISIATANAGVSH